MDHGKEVRERILRKLEDPIYQGKPNELVTFAKPSLLILDAVGILIVHKAITSAYFKESTLGDYNAIAQPRHKNLFLVAKKPDGIVIV